MQGAVTTRASGKAVRKDSSNAGAPASSQERLSQTPQGKRWRRLLALLHRVQVRVKSRDLPDFRHGKPHLFRQRGQMTGGQMPEPSLDAVQILDQKLPVARRVSEQLPHFRERFRLDLAPLGLGAPPTALLDRFFRHVTRILPANPLAPDIQAAGRHAHSAHASRGLLRAARIDISGPRAHVVPVIHLPGPRRNVLARHQTRKHATPPVPVAPAAGICARNQPSRQAGRAGRQGTM